MAETNCLEDNTAVIDDDQTAFEDQIEGEDNAPLGPEWLQRVMQEQHDLLLQSNRLQRYVNAGQVPPVDPNKDCFLLGPLGPCLDPPIVLTAANPARREQETAAICVVLGLNVLANENKDDKDELAELL